MVVALIASAWHMNMPARAQTNNPPTRTPLPSPTPIPTMRIYISLPLSGANAREGKSIENAMTLAFEQLVRNPLVCRGAFKLEWASLDGATAADEKRNAERAAADANALAYLGTLSSDTARISAPILNKAGLVMISPANTYPGLTKAWGKDEPKLYQPGGTPNFLRVIPADDVQANMAAKWAKSLGVREVYLLHDTGVYGQGLADAFRASVKPLGLVEVGYNGMLITNTTAFGPLAQQIQKAQPDLIYYGGAATSNVGLFVNVLRGAGVTQTLFLGADSLLNPAFAESLNTSTTRVIATSPGLTDAKLPQRGKRFFADYQKKFSEAPSFYALYGYEAMSVAVRAITTACKKERTAVRDAAFALKNFNGVLGTWSFDANGDTTLTSMKGNRVVKGKWEEVGPLIFK
jgi:branched-chain amino acid transport system substrate-binding protein